MSSATAPQEGLDRKVLAVAGVVVLGAVMSILDTTVVNVAINTLARDFDTSLSTIQWVVTGYTLALATVIPLTGWGADRFGTKRLYMISIALFIAGSALSGLAWSAETLIAFRVLQGLGGGMLMPAGMTILTRAAGPQRVGRVMAIMGVPMLLGPILGPILGGWLVDDVSWRWIFFINLPIGIVALFLSLRILPKDRPEPSERLDVLGLALLSPSLALIIYGLAQTTAHGFGSAAVLAPALVGVVLLASFIRHALHVSNPLIDLRLFANRTFSTASITLALMVISVFGALLLLPLYFQAVRGESALQSGLLLAPQGIGAMLTMPVAGRLADKVGARKIVLPGMVLLVAGMAAMTQITATTPYWLLLGALFVMGLGMGCTMMPITTSALQTLQPKDMARASTATNIVQQASGAIGSAVMATILAALLAGKFGVPTSQGQLAATAAMINPATRETASAMASDAFATTFVWALVLVVLCVIPAFFLPKSAPAEGAEGDEVAPPVMIH
jgi:EmrB/QacA subfamily drug resistance transporter